MMVFTVFLLTVMTFASTSGWLAMEMGAELPTAPNKCYVKSYGKILSPGATWQPSDDCVAVKCEGISLMPNGKRAFTLEYMGCGSISSMPPCEIVPMDLSKKYPSCCPRIECPNDDSGAKKLMDMSDTYVLMDDMHAS
ncbi:unnamed protein product [Cyprideis torosa]|uniref:Uncharacterized protein n=1 Tax=Cyprideis torosa TaxID=163714 RepID=A0A7R8W328_9CRUS|nr:unnamed protein product [Cyprideis torosa]CAG0882565.1 unnamed protein product [Cyprideis torosa]